jgi:GNAT superfamily N-acetyltransferase
MAFDLKYFDCDAKAVYLGDVEVSPKCQGQGIGSQLMAAVIEHARAWPVDAVRTSAYDGAAGAGPFYAEMRLSGNGARDLSQSADDLL